MISTEFDASNVVLTVLANVLPRSLLSKLKLTVHFLANPIRSMQIFSSLL